MIIDRGQRERGWCILRTSPGRTLTLARSLADAGYDVWTPTETVVQQRKTRQKAAIEREAPIMPTFVFVRANRVRDLQRVLALPVNPHPQFSIFRYAGGVPLVADAEIVGLRAAEERAKRRAMKSKRKSFDIGERVRANDGAWTGLSGIIEGVDGKFALVFFGRGIPVSIATYLLEVDEQGTDAIHIPAARKSITA